MKTLTLAPWFALILMCQAALGQGLGLVNLNNNFTPAGGTAKAFILGPNGLPLQKGLGSVEILDSMGQLIRSGGMATAGIFVFGVVRIPGTVPGGGGSITIRAWDNSTGATFDTAGYRFSTVVTLSGLGGDGLPIPTLGQIGNFFGFGWVFPPPELETNAQIERIIPFGDQLRVVAKVTNGISRISWALWSSTNLIDWIPAGVTQRSEGAPWVTSALEWTIPQPSSPTLYRVTLVGN